MINIISIFKKRFQTMFFIVGLLFFLILGVGNVNAVTRTASVSGNWNSTTTWGGSAVPVAGDVIVINSGIIVTVNVNTAAVASVTINAPSANNGITISGANTLTVTGAITMNTPSTGVITSTIDVGAGILSAASIAIPGSSTASRFCTLSVSTGTISISGNITFSGTAAQARLIFSGAGILNVGGTFGAGGTFTASTGTVNCNLSGDQSVAPYAFNNLTLSGSGIKTFTTTPTVNGILSMEGTASVVVTTGVVTYGTNATLRYNTASARTVTSEEWLTTFNATGGVVINNTGTITLNEAKIFNSTAPLTISNGASLSMSSFLLTLNGNFVNSGTASGTTGGVTIAGTATQNIGAFTTTGTVSLTKTGGIATLQGNINGASLTINGSGGTLNLGTGLTHTFTGTWTRTVGTLNGGSSLLKIGGSVSGTGGTFTASTGTVEWNASGSQSIAAVAYNNLILSGSGAKSIITGTSVAGNLSISGATASINTGINITANSLTLGGFSKINGTWGSTTSSATYKDNTYFAATTGLVTVTTDTRPTPSFSNLTVSQSICYGTSTVTLIGTVSATGPVYPANGETIGITINGNTQNTTISDGVGGFSINFNTATIPASITPYTVTYNYSGNTNLSAAPNNTDNALTVNPAIITGTAPGSRCGSGTVSLSASTSVGTINWYAASIGGSSLGVGSIYTTPSISSNTTYYVDVNNSGCISSTRTPVTAYIVPLTSIVAAGGGTYCGDSNFTLTSSGTNTTNQYWAGPNSFYSTSQNPVLVNVTPAMSGTYTVTGSALSGINLVTNGDFELGNTTFTSSYTLAQPTSNGLYPEGTYDVISNPQSRHSNFATCGDHTSGSGLQMVVNGAIAAGSIVWSQTVNVIPGSDYQFTYWEQSVVGDNPSQLQLYANGSPVGVKYTVTSTTCLWQKFIYNWNSGSSTTAVLSLVNQNTIASGNDFALDDIFFEQVCAATDTVNVTVNAVVTAGSIGTAQTICSGATPASFTSITAGTGSGSISYEWQTNASGSYVTISGAIAATYSPPALTNTTSYKRRTVSVNAGITCYSLYTTPVTITVSSHYVVAGGPNTVCQSVTPSSITLSGASFGGGASTTAWSIISGGGTLSSTAQTSTPASVTYTPAANYSGNVVLRLTTNVVGGCAAISDRTITVISTPIAPTLGTASPVSGTTICAGYNTGVLTGTGGSGGSTGAANEYQYSINGGSTYSAYTNGSAIATTGATTSIIVQARRTDGIVCSNSSWSTICTWPISSTPISPTLSTATPASGTTICAGYNTGTVTGTGGSGGSTGAANEYQYSINGGSTYSAYTNGAAITTTGATTSVIVQSRRTAGGYGCTNSAWTTICIWPISAPTVNPTLNTATPANGTTICAGYNTGTVTGTGGSGGSTGAANEYQYSINGGSTYSTYTNGSAITTTGATTSVIVQSRRTAGSYGCTNSAWTTICSWAIGITSINSQSTASQTQCVGGSFTPISVTASGAGLSYQWYSNTSANTSGGTSLGSSNGAQTNTYTPQAIVAGTLYYYCIVTGTCATVTSTISGAFIVNPTLAVSVAIAASANPICTGTLVTFTATPTNGGTTPVYQWKLNGSNVGTNSATYTNATLTNGNTISCIITSNASPCASSSPATSNTLTMTVNPIPSSPSANGAFICIGSTATLSASGAVAGDKYKWYDASSGGNLLKTSTNNTDSIYITPVIATTTNYWASILSASGCESLRTQITATFPTPSSDDSTIAATNSWIGHVYDGTNFNTYYGSFAETETFDENFGADASCFSFTSNLLQRSIYTETFSVRYRMNSSKKGLYIVDLGSDDGSRLKVDGNLLYNNWVDQAYSSKPRVLISLNGTSSLVYDFNENGGANRVVFQNLTLVLANNLSSNISQSICMGNSGAAISGDTYGTLPTGISLSGTGYQWTYSTTPGGVRTNISGATAATFTPNSTLSPFNTSGTYYVYRNAVLSSTNNVSPNPYIAANESNTATIIIKDVPVATFSYTGSPYCSNASNPNPTFSGGGVAGLFSSTAGLDFVNTATGQVNLATSTAGIYTVTNTIAASGGCSLVSSTSSITIYPLPTATISGTTTVCLNASSPSITFTGSGSTAPYTFAYTINGGSNQFITTTSGNSVTLTAPTGVSGSFIYSLVSVSGATACSQLQSGSATVIVRPDLTITDDAPSQLCQYSLQSVTATVSGGSGNYAYSWQVLTSGASNLFVPGSTTNNFIWLTGFNLVAGTYDYRLTVTDVTWGCQKIVNYSVTILTNVSPNWILHPNLSCTGQTGVLYSVQTLSGATYSWSVTGGTIASGQGTSQITINWGLSAGSGNVSVNTTLGGCKQSLNQSVTITTLPTATISYAATPYCNSITLAQSVTINGTGAYTGGVYSSTSGLSINSSTGAITPSASTPGTYIVTYTIPVSGGCAEIPVTTNVTITALPVSTFSYTASPYCSNAINPSPTYSGGGVAGTFSSTAGLNFVSATTGQVNLATSTAGSYNVTNTIAASGGCPSVASTSPITIYQLPTATISGTTTVCLNAGSPSITFTGSGSTAPYTFAYTINGGSNQFITTTSGNTVTISVPTNTLGTFVYSLVSVTGATGCSQTQTGSALVKITPLVHTKIIHLLTN